jgi:FMN phosphatase YigB (HAD superfamily)
VVSNANGTAAPSPVSATASVDALFDSCDEGVEPNPRFPHSVGTHQPRPESTVHVGDLYHVDVVGARAAGIGASCSTPQAFTRGLRRSAGAR